MNKKMPSPEPAEKTKKGMIWLVGRLFEGLFFLAAFFGLVVIILGVYILLGFSSIGLFDNLETDFIVFIVILGIFVVALLVSFAVSDSRYHFNSPDLWKPSYISIAYFGVVIWVLIQALSLLYAVERILTSQIDAISFLYLFFIFIFSYVGIEFSRGISASLARIEAFQRIALWQVAAGSAVIPVLFSLNAPFAESDITSTIPIFWIVGGGVCGLLMEPLKFKLRLNQRGRND